MPRKKRNPENPDEYKPRVNALEIDDRFPIFTDLYVNGGQGFTSGNAYRAAIAAGYPEDYAKSHAHQLVARLRLKMGRVMRAGGLDEMAVLKKIKKLWNAKEPKWNAATKRWDKFGNTTAQIAVLQVTVKLLGLDPAVQVKIRGDGEGGAIPLIVKHSIPVPQRPKVNPPGPNAQ